MRMPIVHLVFSGTWCCDAQPHDDFAVRLVGAGKRASRLQHSSSVAALVSWAVMLDVCNAFGSLSLSLGCRPLLGRVSTSLHPLRCVSCQAHVREMGSCIGSSVHSSRLIYASEHFMVIAPFAASQYRVSIVPKTHSPSWLEACVWPRVSLRIFMEQ